MQIKLSNTAKVPVRLLDTSGAPVTGITYSSATAVIGKSDGTESTLTLVSGDFEEANNGLAGKGVYWLTIPSSATDVLGSIVFCVSASGAVDYIGIAEIVTSLAADIPAATWAIDKSMLTVTNSIGKDMIDVLKTILNRARINSTTNKLEIYEADSTTIAFTFDLKDISGSSTYLNATERIPA